MTFSGLHWIRRRQRALAQGVLALFCLVWLQAALAPCAMAYSADGGMPPGMEEHCAYCPPADHACEGDDAAARAGCTYPDQPQVDTRVAAIAPLALALPVLAFVLEPRSTPPPAGWNIHRPPDPVGVPLAVSYCRFLK